MATCTEPVEHWLGVPRGGITVQGVPALDEAILQEGARQGFDLTDLSAVHLFASFLQATTTRKRIAEISTR